MDQHFVPVCYLSGFTDPVVPPGHHPAVWVRRRGTSGWRQRAPRNVASAAEFYSATDRDGRCRRDVECVWTAIEDAVAPLLKKMAIVPFSLTSKEREHLALFVAAQFIRVPAQIEHLQGFLAQVQMKFLELHYGWFRSDPGAMRRHMARFAEETGATLPENLTVEHFQPRALAR